MALPLFEQARPQTLDDIVGQDKAVATVRRFCDREPVTAEGHYPGLRTRRTCLLDHRDLRCRQDDDQPDHRSTRLPAVCDRGVRRSRSVCRANPGHRTSLSVQADWLPGTRLRCQRSTLFTWTSSCQTEHNARISPGSAEFSVLLHHHSRWTAETVQRGRD